MRQRGEVFLSSVQENLAAIHSQAEMVRSRKAAKILGQPFDEEQRRLEVLDDLTKIGVTNWLNQLKDSGQITFFNDAGNITESGFYTGEYSTRDHFVNDDLKTTHEGVFLRVGLTNSYKGEVSEIFIGVKKDNNPENTSFPYRVGLYETSYPRSRDRDYRPSDCPKFNCIMGEKAGYSDGGICRALAGLVSTYEYNIDLISQSKSPQHNQSEFVRFGSASLSNF